MVDIPMEVEPHPEALTGGVETQPPLTEVQIVPRAFVVTNPNLASRAGLQRADRILDVHGLSIVGLGALVRVYAQVENNPSLGLVCVPVERQGLPVALTYRSR